MRTQKCLGLPHGFEPPQPSLPDPGRLIPDKAGQAQRLPCPIILILLSAVDRLRSEIPMTHSIAA
jgi:hypothetical protein